MNNDKQRSTTINTINVENSHEDDATKNMINKHNHVVHEGGYSVYDHGEIARFFVYHLISLDYSYETRGDSEIFHDKKRRHKEA